ncbi:MAG: hypothetical protein JXB00_20210 [Bacteroidales bacterium]|nr:hypothetical protein [Bacteroidales bacterium]
MNKIFACFNLKNHDSADVLSSAEAYTDNLVELNVRRILGYRFGDEKVFFDKSLQIVTAMIGYFSNFSNLCQKYNLEATADVEIIAKLYSISGEASFGEFEGLFTVFIWDISKQTGLIFQDDFGSNLPLYYAKNKEVFCVSNSLKDILVRNLCERELNFSAIQDYMIARTMVPNKQTFLKGVSKLIPNHYLMVIPAKEILQVRKIHYNKPLLSLGVVKITLVDVVKDAIVSLLASLKPQERTCTLSSGYDSNIVLFYMTDIAYKIRAITIGGQRRDEIPNAAKVAEQYGNVVHDKIYVEENKLDVFADIVWRTEGYTCESGLIMQYEISSLLHKLGLTELINGEGADHVMDRDRLKFHHWHVRNDFKLFLKYFFRKELWPQKFRESKLFKYIRKPTLRINYDIELDYILKKSGTLSNSFGVQQFYPLLNRTMRQYGEVLGKLNANKAFYKKELEKVFGESKMKYIAKAGGATDVEYLFNGYEKMVDNMLSHSLVRSVLHPKRIEQVRKDPMKYSELVVRLLNLYVFEELFVSGKYDEYFSRPAFPIGLKDLVKAELG